MLGRPTFSLYFALVPFSINAFAKPRALLSCLLRLARFIAVNSAKVRWLASISGTVKYAESSRTRFRLSSGKLERSVALPAILLRVSSIDMARAYCAAV